MNSKFINKLIILFFLFDFSILYVPKIAIVASYYPDQNVQYTTQAAIDRNYVKWLETAGAEVLPILPWYSQEYILEILEKSNGVLWMGGARNLTLNGTFELISKFTLEKTIEFNNKGKNFPLYATCLGFELLNILISNHTGVLSWYNDWDRMTPVELVSNNSKIFEFFTKRSFYTLTNSNSTIHFHHRGVNVSAYEEIYPVLNEFNEIIATGTDINGLEFIAITSARKYPIFGFQFHNEKPLFIQKFVSKINSDIASVSLDFALGFVNQARKNCHRMNQTENQKYNVIRSNVDECVTDKYGFCWYIFDK